MSDAPYVLTFEPILKEKVWGGRRLAKLGKTLPEGANVGESWEVADLGATSVSGGGGGSARSVIADGALAGKTIQDAMRAWGHDLLGTAQLSEDGGLPILVKYLDAREHLSVQAHPSPAYCALHPEAKLKTESWLVIDADPGAVLYVGVKEGIDGEELQRRIDAGAVESALWAVSAVPGECWTLPSGTVHALGAGVLVAEVQTPSDTTYRLYDWTAEYGRPQREMHLQEGIQAATFGRAPEPGRLSGAKRGVVAETDFYTIESVRADCEEVGGLGSGDKPVVVMLLGGRGAAIASDAGEVLLEAGRTALIPACLAAGAVLRAGPGTEAVIATVR